MVAVACFCQMLLVVALEGFCCGSDHLNLSMLELSAQVLGVQRTVPCCRTCPTRTRGSLVREDTAASTPTNRCSLFNSNNLTYDTRWPLTSGRQPQLWGRDGRQDGQQGTVLKYSCRSCRQASCFCPLQQHPARDNLVQATVWVMARRQQRDCR